MADKETILEASPLVDRDELMATAMKHLAKGAAEGLTIKMEDATGKPFKVISEKGGSVFFGVGGCGVDT